jgi:uncharacterized membrane protein YcaP (DUF421 family)
VRRTQRERHSPRLHHTSLTGEWARFPLASDVGTLIAAVIPSRAQLKRTECDLKDKVFRLDDAARWLFGTAPPLFLLETFIRTLVIYLALLGIIRLLGKRMNGQLTIAEMAVMVMLGAIVALPMQAADQGILPGVLSLMCVLCFQGGANWLAYKSARAERWTHGRVSLLVKDGVLQLRALHTARVSQEQLFAALRQQDIVSLGQVQRVYLEPCGLFSVYRSEETRPGLSVLPEDDETASQHAEHGLRACSICGAIGSEQRAAQCEVCGHHAWAPAMAEGSA